MKVFVTKCALSCGIEEIKVRDVSHGMIATIGGGYTKYFHGEGREWHRTKSAAIERAEAMRTKKIESLRKQITKLEKLTFL